jgi:hypothetical protein
MSRDDAGGSDADGDAGGTAAVDGPEDAPGAVTDGRDGGEVGPAESGSWQFALDEVGEDAGPPPLEPGSPTREHVLFVLVGVFGTVVLIVGAV